ncbi:MAG TPA: hypothetical protein VEQ10_16965 [Vicinamibacteria bacterium]|nr:hypothetical protein [Vicinamibacteria bacterium]
MEEQATLAAEKTLDRRRFTFATAMAMLAGVAITITEACGSSYSSPTSSNPTPTPAPTPTPVASGDKVGSISSNHGHSAIITAARLAQGGSLDLDIRGTATHTHTVSLSASDLSDIAENKKIAHESSVDSGHSHTVTFNG